MSFLPSWLFHSFQVLLYQIPAKRTVHWGDVTTQSSSHLFATGSLDSSDWTRSHILSWRAKITFPYSFFSPQSPVWALAHRRVWVTAEPIHWNGYFPKSTLYASWHDPLASVRSIIKLLRMAYMYLWSASTSPYWNGTEEGERANDVYWQPVPTFRASFHGCGGGSRPLLCNSSPV